MDAFIILILAIIAIAIINAILGSPIAVMIIVGFICYKFGQKNGRKR